MSTFDFPSRNHESTGERRLQGTKCGSDISKGSYQHKRLSCGLLKDCWSHIFTASWNVWVSLNPCTAIQSNTGALEQPLCEQQTSPCCLGNSAQWGCVEGGWQDPPSHTAAGSPTDTPYPDAQLIRMCFVPWWPACSDPCQVSPRTVLRKCSSISWNRNTVLWNSGKIAPDGPSWHSTIRNSEKYFKQKKHWGSL